jgi:hypothetical protein
MTNRISDTSPRRSEVSTASTSELVRTAAEQTSRLIRDELALARLEMAGKAKKAGIGAGLLGGSGLVAAYGVGALLFAIGLGLAEVMPAWLAALIVAVALFAAAGLLALVGRSEVKRSVPPVPEETLNNVKTVVEDVKERARR